MNHSIIAISASAGSGKTYRIAKEFIKYILPEPARIREILAITFTNKAAAEMKERVLTFLIGLSGNEALLNESQQDMIADLREEILAELGWDEKKLQKAAAECVDNILYSGKTGGYSDFSVMTIDAFTSRMTKVFAYELDIPPDYAVGMNMKNIIKSSVDKVIARADPSTDDGSNITDIIKNHILYQIEQNQNLMIENEINSLANNLRRLENSFNQTIKVPPAFTENFQKALSDTKEEIKKIQNYVKGECKRMLAKAEILDGGKIDFSHYVQGSRGFFSYVQKCALEPNAENIVSLLSKKYYQDVIQEGIDKLRKKGHLESPDANEYLEEVIDIALNLDGFLRNNISHYFTLEIILKRIYGNLLYEKVNKFTKKYEEENGVIFIDELNYKISKLFEKDGEVPFVYFRMGESFKKYMVDEFQDTSTVQWKNIKPLVDNAKSEGEISMTVGDLKQAIYRFRGGSTDVMAKFMDEPDVDRENLESNWRSDPNIIALNNFFFNNILENSKYIPKSIYEPDNVNQRYRDKSYPEFSDNESSGYCELNLIKKDADMKKLMIEDRELIKIIKDVQSRGYKQSSIGILVRTNGEGNEVAELLSSDDADVQDINILSADTLFIKNNPFVDFIINLLKYSMDNEHNEAFVRLVHLWQDIGKSQASYEQSRDFIVKCLIEQNSRSFSLNRDEKAETIKLLWGNDVFSQFEKRIRATINSVSVYESINLIVEIIINPLCRDYSESIAHITKLRDTAYKRMKEENTFNFLKYYDEYKNDLNIPAPASKNAVTISTIHKSKGLQYDVVIVPFAKWNGKINHWKEYFIYNEPGIAVRYGDLKKEYNDYIEADEIEKKIQSEEETLFDDINLLYVAMTRACEELYIYSNEDDKYNEMDTLERLFTKQFNALKETGIEPEDKETHESIAIGTKRQLKRKQEEIQKERQRLIAHSHQSHMFIDRKMYYIINKHKADETNAAHGNIIHQALSGILTDKDIGPAVQGLLRDGIIAEDEAKRYRKELQDIIKSSAFEIMFDSQYDVLNERNIVFDGEIKRPDRVLLKDYTVLIFDYKTGVHKEEYEKQLVEYMNAYKDMGYEARGFIAYTMDKKLQEVKA